MGREWEAKTPETRFQPPRQMPTGILVKLLGMAQGLPTWRRTSRHHPSTPCAQRLLCLPTFHSRRQSSQTEVLGAPALL